jgi:predicted amidohydrolase YtcJ
MVNQEDLFKIEPREIGKTKVLLTMVGGRAVYESPEWKKVSDGR